MNLEERYYVIKKSDCSEETQKFVSGVAGDIRKVTGKPPLECLVIEKDWPEYEPALRMLLDRVDGKPPKSIWQRMREWWAY